MLHLKFSTTVLYTLPITLWVEFFLIFFEFSFLLMHWQTFWTWLLCNYIPWDNEMYDRCHKKPRVLKTGCADEITCTETFSSLPSVDIKSGYYIVDLPEYTGDFKTVSASVYFCASKCESTRKRRGSQGNIHSAKQRVSWAHRGLHT